MYAGIRVLLLAGEDDRMQQIIAHTFSEFLRITMESKPNRPVLVKKESLVSKSHFTSFTVPRVPRHLSLSRPLHPYVDHRRLRVVQVQLHRL